VLDRTETTDGVSPVCALCGSDQARSMFDNGGHHYWRCRGCGLTFARGGGNANFHESIDDYEPAYRQYLNDGPVDAANLDDVIRWIESHVTLSAATRVLEVGAGSGKLVRRLRRDRSCLVSAIEPSTALFNAYSLATLGIEPITLPQLASRQAPPFDVVTVLDVIEHIPESAEFVEALARVTRPGGFVFLSTPDPDGPLARLLGRRWHHYNAYHFSLYGKSAIAAAARRGGFRVVSTGHRAKRMSLDYLWNYAMDFALARRRTAREPQPSRFGIPINVFDTISIVWQRDAEAP
jgi:2-polyprenyl-3-methyl-5-hydroxy-6-metoxy-1,4-benzoquinol methylase